MVHITRDYFHCHWVTFGNSLFHCAMFLRGLCILMETQVARIALKSCVHINLLLELVMTLLEILKEIKAGKRDYTTGICGNVARKDKRNEEVHVRKLKELWSRWPKFSGRLCYPVPDRNWISKNGNPTWKFDTTKDYWNPMTRYGRDRHRLLNWLIQELEREKNS